MCSDHGLDDGSRKKCAIGSFACRAEFRLDQHADHASRDLARHAPQIITAMRIALGIAWLVVVAAEMIAVNSGLGYLIIDARNAGKRYDLVVAGMVIIGIIGWLLDLLMRQVESSRALKWAYGVRRD